MTTNCNISPEILLSDVSKLRKIFNLGEMTDAALIFTEITRQLGLKRELVASPIQGLKILPAGADSRVILKIEHEKPYVVKIGAKAIIEKEINFLRNGPKGVFPIIYDEGQLGPDAWYAMEAANSNSTENLIFADKFNGLLHSNWFNVLIEMVHSLKSVMDQSLEPYQCKVADYHYTKRISAICKRADFRLFAIKVLGSQVTLERILNSGIIINGQEIGGLLGYNIAVSRYLAAKPARYSSIIHGDLHLKNILQRLEGKGFILIDPRLQWDQQDIDRFGFGDPIYDASTMLHSIGVMTFLLDRIQSAASDDVCRLDIDDNQIAISISPQHLDRISEVSEAFLSNIEKLVPSACLTEGWQVRLFVGTANALLGWLKYENAIQTREAWTFIYAAVSLFMKKASEQILVIRKRS